MGDAFNSILSAGERNVRQDVIIVCIQLSTYIRLNDLP